MSLKQSSLVLFCLLSTAAVVAAQKNNEKPTTEKETTTKQTQKMEQTKTAPEQSQTTPAQEKQTQLYTVIDAQKIIMETGIDKEPMQKLTELQQKYQKELKDMADSVLKLEQELKTKASTLSADAIKAKQAEYEEKNQTMQLRLNRANNELREADMKARTEIFQELQKHAQENLVDKQGYKIVFERSGGIIAFAKDADSSDEISKVIKAATDKKAKEAKTKDTKAKNGQAAAAQATEAPATSEVSGSKIL